ncbi:hypothetical protein CLV84_2843 [Neolewinella xylanilytica]|uniref:Uncharacterized protein n=1 Tax=Neolewinella xylanilytica TaxID=1514080 RepID=A0A2S6I445_9BACT|nr:hypothetical protein [Neolewinella xylanilytica]PPK85930.1 hypothetical protein CLV84_2843 [Neolewinella xylanilytica]
MPWIRNTTYAFFTLLLLPLPFVVGDLLSGVRSYYNRLYEPLVNLVSRHLLGTGEIIRYADSGSGDGLYNWLYFLTLILMAAVAGGLITAIWKDRPRRSGWPRWILCFLAFALSYYLLIYGFAKLFRLQFVRPPLMALYETYGRSSPMHLLWTFMGYSRPYVIFTGLVEVLAGVLLLPRRTRTAGALLTLGIMVHVLMLNLSYDVPVKLFSAQLILYALVIIWQDRARLWQFMANRPIAAGSLRGPLRSNRGNAVLSAAKYVSVAVLTLLTVGASVAVMKGFRGQSPLYGVYEVTEMYANDRLIPPLVTDTRHWRRIIFDRPRYAAVTHLDNTIQHYTCDIDTMRQHLQLLHPGTGELYMALHYEATEQGLKLTGRTTYETVTIQTKTVDLAGFGINRGLHWVNEVPYNRYQY